MTLPLDTEATLLFVLSARWNRMPDDIDDIQQEYIEFLEEREWNQYHTPQNVAQAISVEAAELLELFLWHDNIESEQIANYDDFVEEVRMEIADILIYSMSMAHQLDIDLTEAVTTKLEQNKDRFDMEVSKKIREEKDEWQRK
ncbi:nucleotide pyrophosphohydrolase [Halocatena marina]|uniref:nucleotide pyrophosphohydrolase n=1 Tax=Halocatena marina TaxID=2934937 RepID=UPI00200D911B|nr:nucleotide pyrophosphohydrolase [Halocatena marina]